MPCAGFSADTYDRYVLGLLEEPDRSQLENQIQEQCPACLKGVQRSMNLWLVFATTLENAEPSADFKGRLVRIAELSRKVLTFPKNSALRDRPSILTSTLIAIFAAFAALLFATWEAGRQSIKLDTQPGQAALEQMSQDIANTKTELIKEKAKTKQIETDLGSSGRAALSQANKLQQQLLESQAAVEQYKAMIDRDHQEQGDNLSLLTAITSPNARLLPMKGTEGAAAVVAYVLLVENTRIVFVAANLPKPLPEHTYQLWLMRKEAPKFVSAGIFSPDSLNRAVVAYDQASLVENVSAIAVTEEPTSGSPGPTGPQLLEVGTGSTPASED